MVSLQYLAKFLLQIIYRAQLFLQLLNLILDVSDPLCPLHRWLAIADWAFRLLILLWVLHLQGTAICECPKVGWV